MYLVLKTGMYYYLRISKTTIPYLIRWGSAEPRLYLPVNQIIIIMKSKVLTLAVAIIGAGIVVSTAITIAWVLAVIMGH